MTRHLLATTLVLATAAALATPFALAQDTMSGDTMGGGMMGQGIAHDPAYFRERVLPLLERDCIGCHDADDPDNETRHKILAQDDGDSWSAAAVETNYKSITRLLHPQSPARSLLLLKLVPMDRGGVDHDGGKADGSDFDTTLIDPTGPLVAWTFGATAQSAPPIAVLAPWKPNVATGEELALDASLSYDPDGDDVTVAWSIVEAPLGSQARLTSTSDQKTTFTPDRAGPYLLRCAPKDEKLTGWPVLIRFGATRARDTADTGAVTAGKIPTHERRLTRTLFFDTQGRSPTEEEMQRLAAMPYAKRVDTLLDSVATWEHWFNEEAFFFLLIDRFRPTSDRLLAVPQKMKDGHAHYLDAHREFALSAEFNARNPGNDTYVTVVLEQFLGMEVQSNVRSLNAAKKMYDGQKARLFKILGANQSDVVKISLAQPDCVEQFATRMEFRYLGAPLPAADHTAVVERLRMDPHEFRAILRDWLTSPAYTATTRSPKVKDDHQFIRSLFVDLLGRPPGLQEFRNMRNALQAMTDPAPIRGVLAKVMLDSGAVLPPTERESTASGNGTGRQPPPGGRRTTDNPDDPNAANASTVTSSQILELFNRFLGRDPSEAEALAFVDVCSEPGATWRTAALALLTSSHYQYY